MVFIRTNLICSPASPDPLCMWWTPRERRVYECMNVEMKGNLPPTFFLGDDITWNSYVEDWHIWEWVGKKLSWGEKAKTLSQGAYLDEHLPWNHDIPPAIYRGHKLKRTAKLWSRANSAGGQGRFRGSFADSAIKCKNRMNPQLPHWSWGQRCRVKITIDMLLTWVSPALSKIGAGYIPVVR